MIKPLSSLIWYERIPLFAQYLDEQSVAPLTVTYHLLANFANGLLHRGLNSDAKTTVLLDRNILQSIITDFDTNQIMGAFMSGQIRVEGDMSQLMAL